MKQLQEEAKQLQDQLVTWRRHLHENPEIGMELPKTAQFVKEALEKMGYAPEYIAGTGVTATVGGQKPGKCFLLRADMDALPIMEQTDEPFRSENGHMHACGHDFHTTMLLGAAQLLKNHEAELCGTVKLMFQPAEETLKGAKALVEAGILENPKVDAAMMIHVGTGLPLPEGVILLPAEGAFTAASDWFDIHIQGKGGHGAMPDATIDPLNVMSHIHLALQAINSREISPDDTAVVTVGMMNGGTAHNIIPDTAVMSGTIRTYDNQVRAFIHERLKSISTSIGEAFRATVDPQVIIGCGCVEVNRDVSEILNNVLSDAFGGRVLDLKTAGMKRLSGSEDFAYVSEKVPSAILMISAGNSNGEYKYPMHHPKAVFDESILSDGSAVYAIAAMGWLEAMQTK